MSVLQDLKAKASARLRRAQLHRSLDAAPAGGGMRSDGFDEFGAPEGGYGRPDLAAYAESVPRTDVAESADGRGAAHAVDGIDGVDASPGGLVAPPRHQAG
jgi:hypothetical protein